MMLTTMMATTTLARSLPGLFVQANILLAVSYAAYGAGQLALKRLFPLLPDNPAAALRAAQALVLAALLAPVALALIPRHNLPLPHTLVAQSPLAEGARRMKRRTARRIADERPRPATAASPKAGFWDTDHAERLAALALLLGAAALLARLAWCLLRLRRLVRGAIGLRALGRVRIVVSNDVAIPFSVLLARRACVVLPASVLARPDDLRLAVRHELQHHRNRDTAWALLMELAQCVFYANPAFHLWRRRIVELQEFSCDGALLGRRGVSPHDYGSCLVRVAEAALGNRAMSVGTAGMAAGSGNPRSVKSFLLRRIEMFNEHSSARLEARARKARRLAAGLGTISVFLTLVTAYGAHQSLRAAEMPGPNPGSPILDPVIETITEDVLQRAVKDTRARAGFVVVADPSTGRLLAAAGVGTPEGIPAGAPGALSYLFEPASAVKGVAAAEAIEEGATTEDESHDCERNSYKLGDVVYHDWKTGGFDHLTTAETIIHSSNICGIKIGEELGSAGLERMLKRFGFGPGGVTTDVPGAAAGRYPEAGQLSDDVLIPLISTGYANVMGFYVTPLEMLQAYGAIANGGRLLKPLAANAPDAAVEELGRPLSETSARTMRGILRRAVQEGTGTNAQSRLYTTAGKTSTAYHPSAPNHEWLGGESAIAGFVGFAPVDRPRVAIYAGIIDPNGGHSSNNVHGNTHAAPVFRDVAERVLLYLGVAPDRR